MVEVVAPADVVRVQQVGQVGPGERLGDVVGPVPRHQVALAAHRVLRVGALGGPRGDHRQVGGEAPGRYRLEHVVVQHEVLGVRPVVGDVGPHVVAHDLVGDALMAAGAAALLGVGDEAIHLPAVHVRQAVGGLVRRAGILVLVVHERRDAFAGQRVGHADGGLTALHRDPVGARVDAEVRVERPVLLHDDDHVLDLVYALQGRRGRGDSLRSLGGLGDAESDDGAQCQGGVHHVTKAEPHLHSLPLVWPGIPPCLRIGGRIGVFTFKGGQAFR